MTSPQEKEVLRFISLAWAEFLSLPDKHPSDLDEFRSAIHQLQFLISWRVARRADPETWGDEYVKE